MTALYGDNRSFFPFAPWRLVPREYPSWRGYPDDEDVSRDRRDESIPTISGGGCSEH